MNANQVIHVVRIHILSERKGVKTFEKIGNDYLWLVQVQITRFWLPWVDISHDF